MLRVSPAFFFARNKEWSGRSYGSPFAFTYQLVEGGQPPAPEFFVVGHPVGHGLERLRPQRAFGAAAAARARHQAAAGGVGQRAEQGIQIGLSFNHLV